MSENHIFPLDLTSDRFNNSYVSFKLFEYVVASQGKDKTTIENKNINNAGKGNYVLTQDGGMGLTTAGVNVIALHESGIIQGLAQINHLDLTSERKTKITGMIKLPLPNKIINSNNISWSDVDMSKVVALQATSDTFNNSSEGEGMLDKLSKLALTWGSKKNENSSIMHHAKTASADLTDQAFNSVNKREISFEWEFVITSAKEGKALNELINFMEERTLPEVYKTGIGLDTFFLNYPDSCSVYFIKNGKENPYLPKYTDMVIYNFSVEYGDDSGNGMHLLEGDEPIAVKLSFSLREKVARTRDLVKRNRTRTIS